MGKSRRATEATDINSGSSRSHAVLQLLVEGFEPTGTGKKRAAKRGLLTLVDCAGSERKEDSNGHSKERQKETVEINAR